MSQRFYRDLPEAPDWTFALQAEWQHPFPPDWTVFKADMVGSTPRLLEGRYKEVNSASSMLIIATANVLGHMTFPFLFLGDGVTLAVYGSEADRLLPVLVGTVHEIHSLFGFDYRLASFPVEAAYRLGLTLSCGVVRVSSKYRQAVLLGSALDWMDQELKTPGSPFLVDPSQTPAAKPDLRGFSCRWQDFPSPCEETVSVIVKPLSGGRLAEAFQAVKDCVPSLKKAHPLRVAGQRMSFRTRQLRAEAAVMSGATRGPLFRLWLFLIRAQMLLLKVFIALNIHIRVGQKELCRIPRDNVESCDSRKVENSLYLTLALDRRERECLQRRLEALRKEGKIAWGMHVAKRATLTCLVRTDLGEEVHFVDASGGGYALASRQLKSQLRNA